MGDRFDALFPHWLAATVSELGGQAAACLRLDNPLLRARIDDNRARQSDWLAQGRHGEMDYLVHQQPARVDPWGQFPFARSVIVVAFDNRWGQAQAGSAFPAGTAEELRGYLSAYVCQQDYHVRGRELLQQLAQRLDGVARWQLTVDSSPVDERLFAELAGLGEIGANNLLRLPDCGSRVFLGCLFVDRLLPEVIAAQSLPFSCNECRACLQACPTGALAAVRDFDARRCISYLTIEKKTLLSAAEERLLGDWIFGCDGCTACCPPVARSASRIAVDLEWLLLAPGKEVQRTLQGQAPAYTGVSRLRRNAVAVLKNRGGSRASQLLEQVRRQSGSALVREQIDVV